MFCEPRCHIGLRRSKILSVLGNAGMTGRFRDFTLVPLKALLSTGNNVPAVYDQTQLQTVEHEGRLEKLWDESQMRANLLPHVAAAIQAKK